ncbi:MAG: hypothetical protein ACRET0_02750 [Steroidobacteraceae bacterium]
MSNWLRISSYALLAIALPIFAAADHDSLSALQGYYSAPSACTERENDKLVPCSSGIRDCFLIKRLDATHAQVSISRVEINAHSCSVDNGVAILKADRLVYIDKDPQSVTHGSGASIKIGKKRLTINYAGAKPTGFFLPFCGSGASLEGFSFELTSREPIANHTCGD